MKKNLFKTALYGAIIASVSLAGCSKNDGPGSDGPGGEDGDDTRWITLTAALPGNNATTADGNGGSMAYAITHDQAIDPNHVVDIYSGGKLIESTRTSRVQVSSDGKFLHDIQYIGPDPGLFQTHTVQGQGEYRAIGQGVSTNVILGNTPRWIMSTDAIGIGINSDGATLTTEYEGTGLNATFTRNVRTVHLAILNLENPGITNTRSVPVAFPDGLAAQGYTLGRTDVPLLNKAQNKIYIGCNVSKIDPTKPSLNASGQVVWTANDNANRTIGTVTLVVDYPSLLNPQLIFSDVATNNNHGYRTKTQYVGTDGHVYQGAINHGTGHQILRISSSTNNYDNSYNFDLNAALGIDNAGIATWKYIQDGIGIVLYRRGGQGGYIALIDLNARTATALSTELEADESLGSVLGQFQNITYAGDYAYVPLTPSGKDGNLWVVNWKEKTIKKGATLKAGALSHYIGAY